jgi:hypothetical protein
LGILRPIQGYLNPSPLRDPSLESCEPVVVVVVVVIRPVEVEEGTVV